LFSDNGSTINSTGSARTVVINAGLTQSLLIHSLTITKTAGANGTIVWSNYGGGVTTFRNCILRGDRTSGGAHNIFMSTANMFVRFERCLFVANFQVLNVINVGNAATSAFGTIIHNCIFMGNLSRTCIVATLNTTTNRISAVNNTFHNWNVAYETYGRTDCINNLFIGNNQDLIIGGSATKANYLNCAFQQQGNDGGWDSTIIFGVTSATEVVDAANGNFNLLSTSSSRNAGRTMAAVTVDYNGLSRPQGSAYDISTFEF
jgi:hypothetical protein